MCSAYVFSDYLVCSGTDARHRPPGGIEGEAAALGNATSGSATDRTTRELKMTVDEAQLILNVKPDTPLEDIVKVSLRGCVQGQALTFSTTDVRGDVSRG